MERVDITSRYEEDPVVKKIVQEYNQETESRLQKIIGWAGVVLDARSLVLYSFCFLLLSLPLFAGLLAFTSDRNAERLHS